MFSYNVRSAIVHNSNNLPHIHFFYCFSEWRRWRARGCGGLQEWAGCAARAPLFPSCRPGYLRPCPHSRTPGESQLVVKTGTCCSLDLAYSQSLFVVNSGPLNELVYVQQSHTTRVSSNSDIPTFFLIRYKIPHHFVELIQNKSRSKINSLFQVFSQHGFQ